MILGLPAPTFTLLHVIISLIGIATGLVAVAGLIQRRLIPRWTGVFLTTTVLTSVTGFFFPAKFGPPQAVGGISLIVLALGIYALYAKELAGRWRATYVVSAVVSLYFNVFVAVVQTFQKIPVFHALAPTQTEPPFAIAQGLVLLAFVVAGVAAVRRFRTTPWKTPAASLTEQSQ
jgi:hypothetical protein